MNLSQSDFYEKMLINGLYLDRYHSDIVSDMAQIHQLERGKGGFHVEIFYRRTGTWFFDLNKMEEEGLKSRAYAQKNSDFGVEYIKRFDKHGSVVYEIIETKCHG